MKLTNLSCAQFSEALAAKKPVPGGGGAAAVTGSLAASLCMMVGNYTIGKKKYADAEEDVKALLEKAEKLRIRLLALADEDAEAFEPLSRAYRIPKDDPARAKVMEQATRNACLAPLEMVRCCGDLVSLLAEMLEKGNVMLISDVGCGASLCRAALESAAMNVYINTSSLEDKKFAEQTEKEVGQILRDAIPKAELIITTVSRKICREED